MLTAPASNEHIATRVIFPPGALDDLRAVCAEIESGSALGLQLRSLLPDPNHVAFFDYEKAAAPVGTGNNCVWAKPNELFVNVLAAFRAGTKIDKHRGLRCV